MAVIVPAIHVFIACSGKEVDARARRAKPGHDEGGKRCAAMQKQLSPGIEYGLDNAGN
jgi:hypothetical protein